MKKSYKRKGYPMAYGDTSPTNNVNSLVIELDLHGYYPDEANNIVDQFMTKHYNSEDSVRIIYGRGEGIMRATVLAFLKNHPFVKEIIPYDGDCEVIFAK